MLICVPLPREGIDEAVATPRTPTLPARSKEKTPCHNAALTLVRGT